MGTALRTVRDSAMQARDRAGAAVENTSDSRNARAARRNYRSTETGRSKVPGS